jgi:hypothetical protein
MSGIFLCTCTQILNNFREERYLQNTLSKVMQYRFEIFILNSPTKCVADIFTVFDMFILVCPTKCVTCFLQWDITPSVILSFCSNFFSSYCL